MPVNTAGGLKSKGHPVGATGVAQIHEIVSQLRGEAEERQIKNPKRGHAGHLIEEAISKTCASGKHVFLKNTEILL